MAFPNHLPTSTQPLLLAGDVTAGTPTWLNAAHHFSDESRRIQPQTVSEPPDYAAEQRRNAGCKAEILLHPLYEQLLSAHVACLRIATPVDQLPRIDAELARSQRVVDKYSSFGGGGGGRELDEFMVWLEIYLSGAWYPGVQSPVVRDLPEQRAPKRQDQAPVFRSLPEQWEPRRLPVIFRKILLGAQAPVVVNRRILPISSLIVVP